MELRTRIARAFRTSAPAVVAGIALFGAACANIIDRITADVVAEGILLQIGDPFGLTDPKTGIVLSLASLEGGVTNPRADPLAGATVTLTADDGLPDAGVTVPEADPGVYTGTAGTGGMPSFAYTSGAIYTITVDVPDGDFEDTYTITVTAPESTQVDGLPDTLGGETIDVGDDLVLTLQGSFDKGIVLVVASGGQIVYDNRPDTPQEAVDFALSEFDGEITIPGSAFADANKLYGIAIAGLVSAGTEGISPNLHLVSAFYAGSATTALVRTAP